jgi:hypothetical protein
MACWIGPAPPHLVANRVDEQRVEVIAALRRLRMTGAERRVDLVRHEWLHVGWDGRERHVYGRFGDTLVEHRFHQANMGASSGKTCCGVMSASGDPANVG